MSLIGCGRGYTNYDAVETIAIALAGQAEAALFSNAPQSEKLYQVASDLIDLLNNIDRSRVAPFN
jgi:hypothetical protein